MRYTSQLWCDFMKAYTQRLRMAYSFSCRALYHLPWRVTSVSSHQVQCNIPTFEALLQAKKCEPVSRTMHVWQRMVARFDAVRLFIFALIPWTLQPHFALWLSVRTLPLRTCAGHKAFVLHLTLARVGLIILTMRFSCPTLDGVLY